MLNSLLVQGSPAYGELQAGDTSYGATATAQTIRDSHDLVDLRWSFSDVFGKVPSSRRVISAFSAALAILVVPSL
jgi:hypothetical protein